MGLFFSYFFQQVKRLFGAALSVELVETPYRVANVSSSSGFAVSIQEGWGGLLFFFSFFWSLFFIFFVSNQNPIDSLCDFLALLSQFDLRDCCTN
jgi:hypothetical protein